MNRSSQQDDEYLWYTRSKSAIKFLDLVPWKAIEDGSHSLFDAASAYCQTLDRLYRKRAVHPAETAWIITTALCHKETDPAFRVLAERIPPYITAIHGARDVLRECAAHLAEWPKNRPAPPISSLTQQRIEVAIRFPTMRNFSTSHLELTDALVETEEELLESIIGDFHPNCSWYLSQLVGEANELLVAYPSEEQLAHVCDRVASWSLPMDSWQEWLQYLTSHIMAHMKSFH